MNFSRMLKQTAVYWANPVSDGIGGRTFADPVEISVRWEDKNEMFISTTGQESRSMAIVYAAIDLVEGGYLYLGTLDDLSSGEELNPLSIDNAHAILGIHKIPNIKANVFLRKAWM